jgi:hypothetical protein
MPKVEISVNAKDSVQFGLRPFIERQYENIKRACPTACNFSHVVIADNWTGEHDIVITYDES